MMSDLKTRPGRIMKVRSSLKSLKNRDKDNQLIIRNGKILIINKKNKRYKAKQG